MGLEVGGGGGGSTGGGGPTVDIDTDPTLGGEDPSDAKVPSQKAVWSYALAIATYGVPFGVSTLDENGKVTAGELPDRANYRGYWDPISNTPPLANGTGNSGDFWLVKFDATRDLGAGDVDYKAGDLVIYSSGVDVWDHIKGGGDLTELLPVAAYFVFGAPVDLSAPDLSGGPTTPGYDTIADGALFWTNDQADHTEQGLYAYHAGGAVRAPQFPVGKVVKAGQSAFIIGSTIYEFAVDGTIGSGNVYVQAAAAVPDNSVSTPKLANEAVTAPKIQGNEGATAGQLIAKGVEAVEAAAAHASLAGATSNGDLVITAVATGTTLNGWQVIIPAPAADQPLHLYVTDGPGDGYFYIDLASTVGVITTTTQDLIDAINASDWNALIVASNGDGSDGTGTPYNGGPPVPLAGGVDGVAGTDSLVWVDPTNVPTPDSGGADDGKVLGVSGSSYALAAPVGTPKYKLYLTRTNPLAVQETYLYSVESNGTALTKLATFTDLISQLYVSPDGTKIAYGSYDSGSGNFQLIIANIDGSSPISTGVFLSANSGSCFWSPDSSKLVYAEAGDNSIFYINADGTGNTSIATAGPPYGVGNWLDNSHVIYVNGLDLRSINIDGSEDTLINTFTSSSISPGVYTPVISPDGSKVALMNMDVANNAFLIIYTISGGDQIPISRQVQGPFFWSPDGEYIFNGESVIGQTNPPQSFCSADGCRWFFQPYGNICGVRAP